MVKSHLSSRCRIFIDGKPVSSDQVVQIPFSDAKPFVFESLRSYRGDIFRLEAHLDRLFESAKTIGFALPKTKTQLKRELTSCLARGLKQNVFLRLGVDERNSYVLVLERKRPDWIYEKGVGLKTAVTRRNFVNAEPPEAKVNAFFNNVLAFLDGKNSEIFDSILLDHDGYVTEGTIWNIFIVKGNVIWTPQTGILKGVTRQFVIECAQKQNISISETNLTRHDLWNADEAFMTNTSGEIVPICSLDGRTIGRYVPGAITRKLTIQFRKTLPR